MLVGVGREIIGKLVRGPNVVPMLVGVGRCQ